jgi:hypothetical protein
MERRSTLPVNEVLAAERRERSWESVAVPGGWSHPSAADRGREVGDLDMAGLNIDAPTRFRQLMPAHRWEGTQGGCPARTPALQQGRITDGGSS